MKKSVSLLILLALVLTLALSIASCTENTNVSSSTVSSENITTIATSEEIPSLEDVYDASYDASYEASYEASREASRYESWLVLSAVRSDAWYGEGPVEASMPDKLPVYEEGSIKLGLGNGYPSELVNRKYRYIYYQSPYDGWEEDLAELRGGPDYLFETYWREHPTLSPDTQEEMYWVTMIKELNITREEMEVLIEEQKKDHIAYNGDNCKFDTEGTELPNLDILYTLDNDIINEYYRCA